MIERVTVRASDIVASERFYETVLAPLGRTPATARLALGQADGAGEATRRLHVAFAAGTRAAVDAFWRVGIEAGYADDGPPGPRPQYLPDYYGAFVLDPDGNSVEAVHGAAVPDGSPATVDHVWLRVADLAAARERWRELAARVRLRRVVDTPGRIGFRAGDSGISVVQGKPTAAAWIALRVHERDDPGGDMRDPHGGGVELLPAA